MRFNYPQCYPQKRILGLSGLRRLEAGCYFTPWLGLSRVQLFCYDQKAGLFQVGAYPVRYSETRHAEVAKRTLNLFFKECPYDHRADLSRQGAYLIRYGGQRKTSPVEARRAGTYWTYWLYLITLVVTLSSANDTSVPIPGRTPTYTAPKPPIIRRVFKACSDAMWSFYGDHSSIPAKNFQYGAYP